jgi:hypothetical protein
MIFAQSIGPLDFWGRWVVKGFLQGTRSRDRARRAVAALLEELLPDAPVERTADPVFLYDRPAGVPISRPTASVRRAVPMP